MEVSDKFLCVNRDWDPSYLNDVMSQDFFDFSNLWNIVTSDKDLVEAEKYSPIVEDISMDDDTLCQEVEKIESELVSLFSRAVVNSWAI